MGYEFQDWFACPGCDEQDRVSTLAYKTEIVFECYECGVISEFEIGEDMPLRNLDMNTIAELADEKTSD